MADGTITVAVEQAIHGALKESIQRIEREFGIRVLEISVDWRETTRIGEPQEFKINGIKVTTQSGD